MTNDRHVHRDRLPPGTLEKSLDDLRQQVASNLRIDPDRLRYVDTGERTSIGVTGERWQIFYNDKWQDMPWHFDGPLGVTRDLVRQWLGPVTVAVL
jgi:hypothetical protein